jgi:hypothetical protein
MTGAVCAQEIQVGIWNVGLVSVYVADTPHSRPG